MSAPRARPILVVLPVLTWQGRNDVDDNGDGLPDSLARERKARVERPFAGGRLPLGFKGNEAKLLAYLDRQRLRYELTTDLALARTGGTQLGGHEGVILAGDARWLPESLGDRLRGFVRGGGRLFSVGLRLAPPHDGARRADHELAVCRATSVTSSRRACRHRYARRPP